MKGQKHTAAGANGGTELFPEDIQELRESRGLTREEFARVLGVRPGTLARWEEGWTKPHGATRAVLNAMLATTAWTGLKTLSRVGPLLGVAFGGYVLYRLIRESRK
ncbi:helix-turn-helix domain-containing protein [bacterium]|nr:helix-turn-helix domain-containing protein [bacterium]